MVVCVLCVRVCGVVVRCLGGLVELRSRRLVHVFLSCPGKPGAACCVCDCGCWECAVGRASDDRCEQLLVHPSVLAVDDDRMVVDWERSSGGYPRYVCVVGLGVVRSGRLWRLGTRTRGQYHPGASTGGAEW